MAFLDDLTSLLGGGSAAPATAAGGMTNYGAAPTPQGVAAQTPLGGNILARLRAPNSGGLGVAPTAQNPLGVSQPMIGGDAAAAFSGLSKVDPTASRFGAFAQGLAGGLGARQQAQFESTKLGIAERNANLENLIKGLQLRQVQQQLDARAAGAAGLRNGLAGINAPTPSPDAVSTPAPSAPMPLTAPTPDPSPQTGGASSPAGQPPQASAPNAPVPMPAAAPATGPAAPDAPSVAAKMIPHSVAARPDFWAGVNPDSNPAMLDKTAGAYEQAAAAAAADPETAKRYSDSANQYRMRAQNIRGNGMVTLNDGSQALIPGFATSKATAAAISAAAVKSAESQFDLEKVQPQLGGPTMYTTKAAILNGQGAPGAPPQAGQPPSAAPGQSGPAAPGAPPVPSPQGAGAPAGIVAQQPAFAGEAQKKMADDEVTMAQQFQQRQVSRDRLQTMVGILQNYQPGAFAEQKADVVAKLRGVGLNVPDSATANPAAFQEFMKYASANVLSDLKDQGGGQPLVSEMESLKKANASPDLQPAAVAALLSHSLGVVDYKDAHYKAYADWKKANPYATSTADFETGWAKDNPISKYTEPVVKSIGYQGQDIPAAAQRTVGQTYMTPKGPLVWQGGGWAKPTATGQ